MTIFSGHFGWQIFRENTVHSLWCLSVPFLIIHISSKSVYSLSWQFLPKKFLAICFHLFATEACVLETRIKNADKYNELIGSSNIILHHLDFSISLFIACTPCHHGASPSYWSAYGCVRQYYRYWCTISWYGLCDSSTLLVRSSCCDDNWAMLCSIASRDIMHHQLKSVCKSVHSWQRAASLVAFTIFVPLSQRPSAPSHLGFSGRLACPSPFRYVGTSVRLPLA